MINSLLNPLIESVPLYRQSHLLVTPRTINLPDRCVKCNRPADGYRLHKKFHWHSKAVSLLAFSPTILIYAIVALIVQKRCIISIGLCPIHRRRRVAGLVIGWSLLVGGGLCVALGVRLVMNSQDSSPVTLVVLGLCLLLAAAAALAIGGRVLVPKKADDAHVWYAGAGLEFLRALPNFQDQ